MIIPGFGMVSHVVSTFSTKPIFGLIVAASHTEGLRVEVGLLPDLQATASCCSNDCPSVPLGLPYSLHTVRTVSVSTHQQPVPWHGLRYLLYRSARVHRLIAC